MTRLLLLTIGIVFSAAPLSAADTLVPFGSTWSFLDNGTNPGGTWTAISFNDLLWGSGPAELGYGDGDENTVVSFGPSSTNKYITTYFRHAFTITDPSAYDGLIAQLRVDDGARLYLNGTEVHRLNMTAGGIGNSTLATSTVDNAEETALSLAMIDPTLLVVGSNVLAIEVHQRSANSSDITMDLELIGHTPLDPITVIRGPYLQQIGQNHAIVRWRTDAFTAGRVEIGATTALGGGVFTDPTVTSEHEALVTGLTAATEYFYAVGTAAGFLAGPDADHHFKTSPLPASTDPVRLWVLGDSGTANNNAATVRNAYTSYPGSAATDLLLLLGDNAYDIGTDAEYQEALFDMYPSYLRTVSTWPTLGNHEGGTANVTGLGPYYENFTLPTAGENGGLASGTEAYYSFDHGPIHIVCLDSQWTSRSPTGAMLTWLENDLASTDREWIIAFWHHPPYTAGSHESDDPLDSSGRLFDMRENANPIIEAGGVDLVLSGHSHSYERTFLLDGHYGVSSTLTGAMLIDAGNGDPNGDGSYSKPTGGAPHAGTVYITAGSSGQTGSGPLNHPAMVTSQQLLGSVVIDVIPGQMEVRFLRSNGAVTDTFAITKSSVVGEQFIRGDSNGDGLLDISDPISTLAYLFQAGPADCLNALDANDSDSVNIADVITVLSVLFTGGTPLAAPYPNCGVDLTPGAITCDIPPCP